MRKNKKNTAQVLRYQINERFIKIMAPVDYGRKEAKKEGKELDLIFAKNTLNNYKQFCNHFAQYVNERDASARSLDDAKKYVEEYIESLRDRNLSASTQKSYLSALRKLYDEDFENIKTDARCRAEIVRSRNETLSNRKFSEEKHADFVDFCKHTGLRRSEVEKLRGSSCSLHNDGHWYIDGVKGKGGKVRDVRILNDDKKTIDLINSKNKNELLFGLISKHANIHGWRADYAQSLYESLARPVESLDRKDCYKCRTDYTGLVLDKSAMQVVSQSLGHNRLSVISENYLYGLRD